MKVLVFSARRYSFTAKDTGELIEGARVSYLEPIEEIESVDQVGTPALEVACPMSLFPSFKDLPAVCDVEFGRRPGRGGKPDTQMVKCEVLSPISVASLLSAGKRLAP